MLSPPPSTIRAPASESVVDGPALGSAAAITSGRTAAVTTANAAGPAIMASNPASAANVSRGRTTIASAANTPTARIVNRSHGNQFGVWPRTTNASTAVTAIAAGNSSPARFPSRCQRQDAVNPAAASAAKAGRTAVPG